MMAKSLEDTAFYRFHRLLALNEVGGDAAAQGLSADTFHAMMRERIQTLPHGMTATATHDTKRGEDARTRLLALPELADEWASMVGRWKEMNARHVTSNGNMRSPSLAFEYMLYQALIGAWPDALDDVFVERMKAYAIKAAREAKLETSWLNPNAHYENALERFIESILDTSRSADFIGSIQAFARRTSLLGALNSLSQITLKTMMPGVPDFYQGTEFWDCSLVDPDNRRPVDFAARQAAITMTENPDWDNLVENWPDGRIKLAWTQALLKMRHTLPDVFMNGDYDPIMISGPDKDHVIAFARQFKSDAVIIAVGRRLAKFSDDGRVWPREPIDAALDLSNYAGDFETANVSKAAIPCSALFTKFPATIVRVKAVHPSAKEKSPAMRKAAREHGRTA
jgi:(1->4)-alpha-D-glucan 1-alpha-D-glucosylmutase